MTRIGELCAGYGGLGMAVQSVLGGEMVWCADNDPGASKILAHHWPTVPNHGDLTTTDWATVEPVDIITAGWPCQPWSLAGKGKGAQDERAIWPAIADAVRHLRPRYVVLENVAAIVVLGELARAVGDLAGLGYDAQWLCLRASDVGATHGRNRCFIAATDTADLGHQRGRESRDGWAGSADSGSVAADSNGARSQGAEPAAGRHLPDGRPAAHTDCATGPVTGGIAPGSPQGAAAEAFRGTGRGGGAPATNADRDAVRDEPVGQSRSGSAALAQHDVQWGQYEPAIRRWESVLGRCAPAPTELGRTGNPRLSPRFVEWLMGLPAGHVTDVPGLSRNEQLKALGNGVVSQQAAAALQTLLNVEEVAA